MTEDGLRFRVPARSLPPGKIELTPSPATESGHTSPALVRAAFADDMEKPQEGVDCIKARYGVLGKYGASGLGEMIDAIA